MLNTKKKLLLHNKIFLKTGVDKKKVSNPENQISEENLIEKIRNTPSEKIRSIVKNTILKEKMKKTRELSEIKEENARIDFINFFERTRQQRSDINEKNIKTVLEALKPIFAHNFNYLSYAVVKGYFLATPEQKEREARHNALTTILGRVIGWSVGEGRELAFKILEETNDHKTAEAVKPILGV